MLQVQKKREKRKYLAPLSNLQDIPDHMIQCWKEKKRDNGYNIQTVAMFSTMFSIFFFFCISYFYLDHI